MCRVPSRDTKAVLSPRNSSSEANRTIRTFKRDVRGGSHRTYYARVATIGDVARRAGVSMATVSRVLSPGEHPHPVNAETARRVREAASALDFVPSALARGLVSRRSGLLGLIVPDLADPHYPRIARGAEDVARAAGRALLVCNTLGDPRRLAEYLHLLRGQRVDALVVSGGSSLRPAEMEAICRSGLPAALIGRPAGTLEQAPPYVAVDNEAAARAATAHLLAVGRQRVVHLAGPEAQTTMLDRAAGYAETMRAAGLAGMVVRTDGSAEEGARATARLLEQSGDPPPDALFAATDRLAIAALGSTLDHGLRVPRDVAIVGFDDTAVAAYLRPSLSSITQPARELGEAAIALALRLLDGETAEPRILSAQLVVRQSSTV